jgi:hypothetical protein
MTTQELYQQLDQYGIAFLQSLSPRERSRWEFILKTHPWIKRYQASVN